MSDAEKVEIKVDPKTARAVSQLHGAAIVLAALQDADEKPKSTLPGFLLALALVEKEVADMRAQMAGAVYRCAAKAGHNVGEVKSIYTNIGKDGTPVIEVEKSDLVDLATE